MSAEASGAGVPRPESLVGTTVPQDVLLGGRRHAVASLALVAAAGIVSFLVLAPTPALPGSVVHQTARLLVHVGFSWPVATSVADTSLNVALFIPASFAAAASWRRVRWWQWVAVGYLVSAAAEATQWLFLPERTAQFRDVVSNTTGAAIGAGAWVLMTRAAQRQRARTPS